MKRSSKKRYKHWDWRRPDFVSASANPVSVRRNAAAPKARRRFYWCGAQARAGFYLPFFAGAIFFAAFAFFAFFAFFAISRLLHAPF
jgi:hypothetical protein